MIRHATALACLCLAASALAAQPGRFDCGGKVERQTWMEWDGGVRGFVQQRLLRDRLQQRGDVYALYDAQTYMHNLASMARRCKRSERLREIASVVGIAYEVLEPGPASSFGRRWRCRGGICNRKNRLRDEEVMLASVQYLALASSVANALALSAAGRERAAQAFITDTTGILIEHLDRWADSRAIARLRKLASSAPEDVRNGSSALFFTDIDLWLIASHAELAGLLRARGQKGDDDRMREHLAALLRAFKARTSIREICTSRGTRNEADLDRGYWRLYDESRYAGYEGESKPVACSRSGDSMRLARPARAPAPRDDTGWDISHARRLVHALDALARNRAALRSVYGLQDAQLPEAGIEQAFAGTLVARVWNGDSARPLFSNYWSGANGWYRSSHDERSGACAEGIAPYGLSDAFATGGYLAWAGRQPVIGMLGRRLYQMVEQGDASDAAFIARYYPKLGRAADAQERSLARLMFLASLVAAEGGPV
ncbi:MAG: hypothetical protein JWR25_2198 [Noviherbaspirillum sp.]|nr:hypothetical protein [Noviherbaspirillum sp.]